MEEFKIEDLRIGQRVRLERIMENGGVIVELSIKGVLPSVTVRSSTGMEVVCLPHYVKPLKDEDDGVSDGK